MTKTSELTNRLLSLIGNRSKREAARVWGINYSTLKNLLTRGSTPKADLLAQIAQHENVSISWLISGDGMDPKEPISGKYELPVDSEQRHFACEPSIQPSGLTAQQQSWLMILDALEPDEAQKILRYFHRKGIDQILADSEK